MPYYCFFPLGKPEVNTLIPGHYTPLFSSLRTLLCTSFLFKPFSHFPLCLLFHVTFRVCWFSISASEFDFSLQFVARYSGAHCDLSFSGTAVTCSYDCHVCHAQLLLFIILLTFNLLHLWTVQFLLVCADTQASDHKIKRLRIFLFYQPFYQPAFCPSYL